jgi:cellulose biosynthesis protein BcsQ
MSAVAFYNLKGGVGKTTAAVNVAYLAAAAGWRVLLWDLDPQGASSFILRVRAHVGALRTKTLEQGTPFTEAIKETDYRNLDLLPADFSYRKFDRVLDQLDSPVRVMRTLLDTLRADYDVVFLDCPAGFSLLTEAVLETVDLSLVPTIPTPLSVQTLARILKWIDRRRLSSQLAPFFSMVDRRKTLHRCACEWSAQQPGNFLQTHIPCASIVEQVSVRRMPLPEFAARDQASAAFADLWSELRERLEQQRRPALAPRATQRPALSAIESLSAELDQALERELRVENQGAAPDLRGRATVRHYPRAAGDMLVHSFDTDDRDLARSGHVLELRECGTNLMVIAGSSSADDMKREQVQIDSAWALQILSGEVSPVAILDRRLGRPGPAVVEEIRSLVGKRRLRRVDSRIVEEVPAKVDTTYSENVDTTYDERWPPPIRAGAPQLVQR